MVILCFLYSSHPFFKFFEFLFELFKLNSLMSVCCDISMIKFNDLFCWWSIYCNMTLCVQGTNCFLFILNKLMLTFTNFNVLFFFYKYECSIYFVLSFFFAVWMCLIFFILLVQVFTKITNQLFINFKCLISLSFN